MTYSPTHSDQRRLPEAPFTANNGGHRDHVIRVGGVTHPEKEAEKKYGE
jgi:hypothetical protein